MPFNRRPDCGDNSCRYALNRTGMRTNGGCNCLENTYYAGREDGHEAGRREGLMEAQANDLDVAIRNHAYAKGVEAAVKYLREHFVKTDRTAADYFAAKIETALLPAPPQQAAGPYPFINDERDRYLPRAAPPAAPAAEGLCGNKDPSSPRRCTLPVGHEGVHDDSRWDDVTLRRRP